MRGHVPARCLNRSGTRDTLGRFGARLLDILPMRSSHQPDGAWYAHVHGIKGSSSWRSEAGPQP